MRKYKEKMIYDRNQFDQGYNSEPFDDFFENAINNSRERVDRFLDIFEEAGRSDMLTLCSNCHCRTLKKHKHRPNLCHVCKVIMKAERPIKYTFLNKLKNIFSKFVNNRRC